MEFRSLLDECDDAFERGYRDGFAVLLEDKASHSEEEIVCEDPFS